MLKWSKATLNVSAEKPAVVVRVNIVCFREREREMREQ